MKSEPILRAIIDLETRNARKAGMLTGILLSCPVEPNVKAAIQRELDADDKIPHFFEAHPDLLELLL